MRVDMHDARKIGLIEDGDWAIASGDDGKHEPDPGYVGPFDLCVDCWFDWMEVITTCVENPPYEPSENGGVDYFCACCKKPLHWADENDDNFHV